MLLGLVLTQELGDLDEAITGDIAARQGQRQQQREVFDFGFELGDFGFLLLVLALLII